MKDFLKTMLACLAALVLASGAFMLFTLLLFGAMIAAGGAQPVVPKDAVLVFDLSANVVDAPQVDDGEAALAAAFGQGGPPRLQLRRVISAIEAAASDDRIRALYLHGSFEPQDYGSGYGALLEVRAAVEKFAVSGKPVIAYLVGPTTRDYLLASAASRIVFNPLGMMMTPGMSAEVLYLGGTFKRYGVGVQIARAGDYKSAGESFVEEHMSPQEREQVTALLGDVWGEFISHVSRSRELADGALQAAIDRNALFSAQQALEAGLVDAVVDLPGVVEELKVITGEDPEAKSFRQISLPDYIASREAPAGAPVRGDQVAVVYAEGVIVDGEGGADLVGGDSLARELRKLRHNDAVKAVVLRVNSPGGSAIASEVIRRELELLHAEKPVVVSMGTVAASGGYWISTACDRVFAQPNTITGSIGVIAMLPHVEELARRFALNVETIKTGKNADIFSLVHPRDPEAMAILQGLVNDIYVKFIDRVAESRRLDRAAVEKVAGGRVWSGADAIEAGLVDEIGGLEAAIADAAARAGVEKFTTVDYPAPRGFLEVLLENLAGEEKPIARLGFDGDAGRLLGQVRQALEFFDDPRGIYARMPYQLEIR